MVPIGVLESVVERLNQQQWPTHCLYVVATPIGNLGDLGLRAWQALVRADVIAAEDTRTARPLLEAWGVRTPVRALHRHNEAQAAAILIEQLQQGQRVALISDAGAPAISDPRSEEHTSELQSRGHLVCRLLLEKKKLRLK